MAKTILIPTDFRVESLNTLRFALTEQIEPVKVILIYGCYFSDSITQLLFYSSEKTLKSLLNEPFEDALNIIKNRFTCNIRNIKFELLHNNSKRLTKNVLDYHKPDLIYLPVNYTLKPGKNGFDTIPLLRHSDIPVKEIGWDNQISVSDDQLQVLFATNPIRTHRTEDAAE